MISLRAIVYVGSVSGRSRSVLAASAMCLLLSGACASTDPTAGSTGSEASIKPQPSDVEDGALPEILRFSAPLLSGGTIDGAALAGRDVALWMWAPW